jgi:hypothetical protein
MNTLDFNFFDGFIKIVAGEVYYNFNYLVKQSHYPNIVTIAEEGYITLII